MSEEMVCRKHRLSSFQIIILGFAGVILLGALLLMLPLSTATILTMYLALFFGGGVFISVYEDLPLSSCLYEAASTVGTVGLTLGMFPLRRTPYCPMTLRFWRWVSIKPCKSASGFERVSHTDRKEIYGEKTTKHSR